MTRLRPWITVAGAILFCLLWPSAAMGQTLEDGFPLHVAIGSYMVLQGVDLAVTEYVIGANRGHESNPLIAPFSSQPATMGAIKMTVAVGTSYAMLRLHKNHPKLAWTLAISGSILYIGVVRHNMTLLPPVRPR